MKASRCAALAMVALGASVAARGDIVSLTVDYSMHIGQTAVFRADLTGFNLGTIRAVTILDANSRSGSSEMFSGFDLDFVYFDRDGDVRTVDDQIHLIQRLSFAIPGVARPAPDGHPRYPSPPVLFGLGLDGSIDHGKVALDARNAHFELDLLNYIVLERSYGWVSLGDGGMITAGFPLISVGQGESMFLCVGDVGPPPPGGQADELSEGVIEVQVFAVGGSYVPGYKLAPGQSVNLDGAPEGSDAFDSWLWDLDDDGQYDDGTGALLAVGFEDLFVTLGLDLGPHTIWLQRTANGDAKGQDPLSFDITLVPDPATWALLLAAVPCALRRRRKG